MASAKQKRQRAKFKRAIRSCRGKKNFRSCLKKKLKK